MVGVGSCGNESKRDRIKGGHLQLTAGEYASAVAVNQNCQQSRWVVRLGAASCVLTGELGQIQPIYDFDNKTGQVVLGELVVQRRR